MSFVVHRSISAVILAAVLAIGGCLPCQQLFAGEPAQKSCCRLKGECQKPTPETQSNKNCNLKLKDFQSEPQKHSAPVFDRTAEPVLAQTTVSWTTFPISAAGPIDSSPPPIFLRNLSLLI